MIERFVDLGNKAAQLSFHVFVDIVQNDGFQQDFARGAHNLRLALGLPLQTDEAGDQHLKLQESGAGIYRTDAVIGGGVWVADITAEKSDTELVRFVQRIFVK